MANQKAPVSSPDTDTTAGNPETDTTSTVGNDSTAASSTAEADSTSSEDANSGESSAADKTDAKEGSLLDIVKDVLEKGDSGEKSSSPDGKTDTKESTSTTAEDPAKADKVEADKALPPFHEHPRWQEKVKEVDTLKGEVEALKGPATQYRNIDSFMKKSNLATDEVVQGFKLMALMKNAPERALAELDSHRKRLAIEIGVALPDDLQAKVDDGFIREEEAKELAKTRLENSRLSTTVESTRKNAERTEEQARADFIRDNNDAVDVATKDWEKVQASKDPDYHLKQPRVVDRVIALTVQRRMVEPGKLITPAEAVAISEQAYRDVNEHFKKLLPTPAPRKRTPSSSVVSATTKPKTMVDAVRQGLQSAS